MTKKRRQYTAEFKEEAIKLCEQPGASITEIARNLNIDHSVLRRWAAARRNGGQDTVALRASPDKGASELDQLRRELKRVTMERDILKKALGYFAKDPQ